MRHPMRKLLCHVLAHLTMAWPLLAQAQTTGAPGSEATVQPIQAIPPVIAVRNARPMIMLNMSRDHQLFYRAYTEFADLDPERQDGVETTYKHRYIYEGYFDPRKCYGYNSGNGRFEPQANADASNLCTDRWSGNFLNWATMTRMDIVRKVLYGGKRVVDTRSLTVLERAHLPTDAHSFAKYYAGSSDAPVNRVTPFDTNEVTLCNTTYSTAEGTDRWSHTTTRPPLVRVARGNHQLWNANERWQCLWREERETSNSVSASVMPGVSTLNPQREQDGLGEKDYVVRVEVCNSSWPGSGSEGCQGYGSGNTRSSKPTGLLHEFSGSDNPTEFALLTGSFDTNISGGVLRANMADFLEEVDAATGQFISPSNLATRGSIVRTLDALRVFGYDYTDGLHRNPTSAQAAGNFCSFQTIGLTEGECVSWGNPMGEMMLESLRYLAGQADPSPGFSLGANSARDRMLDLPAPTWRDPFYRSSERAAKYGKAQCRPVSLVNFNASVVSYDGGSLGSLSDLTTSTTAQNQIDRVGAGEGIHGSSRFIGRVGGSGDRRCTAKTINSLSQVDGLCPDAPGYEGSFSSAGLAYWAHTNRVRRSIPGVTITNFDNQGDLDSVTGFVNTFSVALSPGKPRIEVKDSNGNTQVVIQPSYELKLNAGTQQEQIGAGTLVDFRVLAQDENSGRYLVVWEDSEQGGDYDQDAAGILEWRRQGNQLTVTTSVYAESTDNPQGFGYTISGTDKDGVHYHSGILGYSYTDASNLTVTALDGSAHPQVGASGGCNNCQVNDPPSRAQYEIRGNAAQALEDPLWYAAKWGGYAKSSRSDLQPDSPSKWDSDSDGSPDNYFLVYNPANLRKALKDAFAGASRSSNTAPAISSRQLTIGSSKYVTSFDPDVSNRHGEVLAYQIGADGDFQDSPSWTANERLAQVAVADRIVITDDVDEADDGSRSGPTGKVFSDVSWSSLSATYRQALIGPDGALTDASAVARGQALIRYMRGDRQTEQAESEGGFGFRPRPAGKLLGPIINSVPWVQGPPAARYVGPTYTTGSGTNAQTYAQWAAERQGRDRLLWVGSNDGMLHAFRVLARRTDGSGASLADGVLSTDGRPVLSYAPGVLASRWPSLVEPDGGLDAMVDGSPFGGDVIVNGQWRSYIFGTLGRGGRAIYALDMTSTSLDSDLPDTTGNERQADAAAKFKWRFTADDDDDLGYVLSDPAIDASTNQPAAIVRLNNGEFAVMFGNGYRSSEGKAALFILPVKGPNNGNWTGRYTKIVAEDDSTDSLPNGLSAPSWLDVDGNGTVDWVYAGDLQGNLWKFDLRSTDSSGWRVWSPTSSGASTAFFTTRPGNDADTVLPITTAPSFAFPQAGGVMVLFGTGQAIESADFPDESGRVHRMFGVWDRSFLTYQAGSPPTYPIDADTLQERQLQRVISSAGVSVVVPAAGDTPFDASRDTELNGWYFDLQYAQTAGDGSTSTSTAEMVIYDPFVLGDLLIFTTVRPDENPLETSCSSGPAGALYVLDPLTGGAAVRVRWAEGLVDGPVIGLDIEDTRVVSRRDSTSRPYGDGTDTGTSCTEGTPGCLCTGEGQQRVCRKATCVPTEIASRIIGESTDLQVCTPKTSARIQWREIPGLKTK